MQILREVPEGSGEDTVRFWRDLVQIPCEVPEGSSADTWLGSRGFWCRYLFPVQLPDEVPEGLGEDAW